jgi:hypothetical protein
MPKMEIKRVDDNTITLVQTSMLGNKFERTINFPIGTALVVEGSFDRFTVDCTKSKNVN